MKISATPIFCRIGNCSDHSSGIGSISIRISVAMFRIACHSARLLMQGVFSVLTGLQPPATARVVARVYPVTMKMMM